MIMGFDSDDSTIFDRQVEFIQQSRISFSMSGMLRRFPRRHCTIGLPPRGGST